MNPQRVPVNVHETGEALVIVAPPAAVTAKDVTVELRPGKVRFWAHLRSAGPRDYLVHEWHYGGYEAGARPPGRVRRRRRGHADQRPTGHPGPAGEPNTLTIQPSAAGT